VFVKSPFREDIPIRAQAKFITIWTSELSENQWPESRLSVYLKKRIPSIHTYLRTIFGFKIVALGLFPPLYGIENLASARS